MKVRIKSVKVASEYKDGKTIELTDKREVAAVVVDEHAYSATFTLPAVEVDGVINVG